jgi:hypothetical protein
MAVTTLQITQSGSAKSVAALGTYARWVIFQNNAAAAAHVGDANVSASRGVQLAAAGGSLTLQPMPNAAHYDLGQWSTIGTNSQLLDVIYDSML